MFQESYGVINISSILQGLLSYYTVLSITKLNDVK